MTDYYDYVLCKDCGGKCCLTHPGAVFPEEFDGNMEEVIKARLLTGRWVIDWWEGDAFKEDNGRTKSLFIRAAMKEEEGEIVFSPGWKGTCSFLEENGCSLSEKERPKQCRNLKPSKGNSCEVDAEYTKNAAARAWRPHEGMLFKIGKEVSIQKKREGWRELKEETLASFVNGSACAGDAGDDLFSMLSGLFGF